jgi:hypothetical protein
LQSIWPLGIGPSQDFGEAFRQIGDFLGNLKILELMRVLKTSTIYKVERGIDKDREVLILKVANPGTENGEDKIETQKTLPIDQSSSS